MQRGQDPEKETINVRHNENGYQASVTWTGKVEAHMTMIGMVEGMMGKVIDGGGEQGR